MKLMPGALLGLVGGLAVVAVFVLTLLRPTLRATVTTTALPAEYLANGAERWQQVVDPPGDGTARLLALPDGRIAVLAFAGYGAVFDLVAVSWKEGPLAVHPGLVGPAAVRARGGAALDLPPDRPESSVTKPLTRIAVRAGGG